MKQTRNIFYVRASYFTHSIVSYIINYAPKSSKERFCLKNFYFGDHKKKKSKSKQRPNQRRHKTIKIRSITCMFNGKGIHILSFLFILIIIKVCQNRVVFPTIDSKFLSLLLNIKNS